MNKVPSLRFKEFSGEWEEKKLGTIIEKYEDPVETPTEGYMRLGLRSHAKGTFHSYVEKGKELETAKMFRVAPNKFILNITFAWEHAVAITSPEDKGMLVSHRFPQFSFNEETLPSFFGYLILDKKFKNHLELSSPGGAGRNRVLKIKDMLEYKMKFPSKEEQEKIGNFLSSVDKKISIVEEKLNLFNQYKKGIMQKIFNQELRFKDENGNDYPQWEEKKIGDIGKIIGGGTPSSTIEEYWNGNIQWFTPTEVGKTKYIDKSVRTITELGLNKSSAKLLPKGTILLSSRATIGEKSIALKEVCTNQGFQSILVNENNDNEFVYYLLDTLKEELIRQSSGSTFLEISGKKLGNIATYLPCIEEQKKIADFLSAIDDKIENISDNLESLKLFKKSMLQKMFV